MSIFIDRFRPVYKTAMGDKYRVVGRMNFSDQRRPHKLSINNVSRIMPGEKPACMSGLCHRPIFKSPLAETKETDHPGVNSRDNDDFLPEFEHLEGIRLVWLFLRLFFGIVRR